MTVYSKIHDKIIRPVVEQRNGIKTGKHLTDLIASEKWSHDEIKQHQWKRIKIIIKHAYDNCSFYKDRFDSLKLHPDTIRSFDDFSQISPLTRQDLNEHLNDLTAANIQKDEIHFSTTGGSTGLATRFARDNACLGIKNASEYRFNRWAGWKPGDKSLYYWPALADFSEKSAKFKMARSKYYSRSLSLYAGRLNDDVLSEHLSLYIKFRPDLVRAFPSALHRFAEYVEQSGLILPPLKAVISVGEPLQDFQRETFKNIFRCEIFNCYVSRECGNIACECPAHNGLHIAEELIYMEIGNHKHGEIGEVYLTDLWNMGMPFIRYKIQDAARWLEGKCSCGKEHKRIGVDAARISDFLVSPVDNSFVSGSTLLHYLLAEGPEVGRVKLIQDDREHLTVVMTGSELANKDGLKHIQTRLNIIFKGAMNVNFKFVESIPLLSSGKYSFVERKF